MAIQADPHPKQTFDLLGIAYGGEARTIPLDHADAAFRPFLFGLADPNLPAGSANPAEAWENVQLALAELL